jgi:putative membrane protein
MPEILHLFFGTIALRPYVFVFLLIYAVSAAFHLGWRRMAVFIPLGYSLAWMSEFASIHWGFPYGDYYYIPHTADRELWVLGVPFMDSLSYVFLSYCSYSTAIFILSPIYVKGADVFVLETRSIRRSWKVLLLGAFLFVLLDIIIDPVALQGHRWFLGQIYGYRHVGLYFRIPMSNFGGWLLVGLALTGVLQFLDRISALEPQEGVFYRGYQGPGSLGPLLYLAVLLFNLAVTVWIGEQFMALTGLLILFFTFLPVFFFTLYKHEHVSSVGSMLIERHIKDFPHSKARFLLALLHPSQSQD